MSYLEILLTLHVLGAIVGIGPTYTFGVIGALMPTAGPGAIALMEAMAKIEKVLVNPVALFLQPVTGVLLIIETSRDDDFLQREWLWVSIVLYAAILFLSYVKMGPGLHQMIRMAKEGKAQTPEFAALAAVQKKVGPFLGIMGLIIIVLMVWKPGEV